MGTKGWTRNWAAILLVGVLMGCSVGGGGGGDTVTPPEVDLRGTYDLAGFDVDYYADSLRAFFLTTVNEFRADSWGGTMELGPSSVWQSLLFNGDTTVTAGTLAVTFTDYPFEGYFTITDGLGSYDLGFLIYGDFLRTYSGLIYDSGNDWYYEEWDYWVKVSDYLEAQAARDGRDGETVRPLALRKARVGGGMGNR